MADRQRRPRFRLSTKGKLIRDIILLAAVLYLFCVLFRVFPFPTASMALRATEERHLFGPGRVVTYLDWREGLRSYVLQEKDLYAVAHVERRGPFWHSGSLRALEPDPDKPVEVFSDQLTANDFLVLVFAADPAVSTVMLEAPTRSLDSHTYTLSRASAPIDPLERCCLVWLEPPDRSILEESFYRVTAYDAAGTQLWQSPTPKVWAEYGLP